MIKKGGYQLEAPSLRLLRDADSVRFHVDNNDYFGTVATILQLLEKHLDEALKTTTRSEKKLVKETFSNLVNDLMILQNNYQIKTNQNKGKTEAKGTLKSQ